jgi:hypothetical protein
MSSLAAARETGFGEVELRFPFSRDLVDDLKTEIPARHRRYDPAERLWYVTEPHLTAAVALLIAYYPGAQVPEVYRRPAPVVVTDAPWWDDPAREQPPPPAIDAALAGLIPAPAPEADELAPIVILVPCPKCHAPYEQTIRVVAESSGTVAKRETMAPELVSICPHPQCRTLAVVSFYPALAAAS